MSIEPAHRLPSRINGARPQYDAPPIPVTLAAPADVPKPVLSEPLLITEAEAAKLLSIGARTLRKLAKSGEVPSLKIGRSVRYSLEMLRQWITSRAK